MIGLTVISFQFNFFSFCSVWTICYAPFAVSPYVQFTTIIPNFLCILQYAVLCGLVTTRTIWDYVIYFHRK